MFSNSTQIGATTQGTTFADIIINNVNSVANGTTQGFAQFVHDPRALTDMVNVFAKAAAPKKFADAVILRKIETQKLDDIWNFPLNMSVPTTCPIPWTVIESTIKSSTSTAYEFNIMRTVDFIGRNYIRIMLPAVDCTQVIDSTVGSTTDSAYMADTEHMYLGAWHRDLIPRLIEKVEFYPKSNSHKLFEYSGYDIYVHNILFGNAHKEMNDLMSGEDKFELCYDPYRVDGSAMGLASFKGIDAYSDYTVGTADANGLQSYTANSSQVLGSTDGIVDYFQLDTTMDNEEFCNVYRKNVWYEAPVAKNYHARHSIHSRRMYHQKKDLTIPLDILPFGYSIASSLPTAAISGECGFIKISLYSDWLDRAFYLTKVSDIPPLQQMVNHVHYAEGDTNAQGDAIASGDARIGWVNERSPGRYGDPDFVTTAAATDDGFESATRFSQPGNIVNGPIGSNARENIVQTTVNFEGVTSGNEGLYRGSQGNYVAKGKANIKSTGNFKSVVRTTTASGLSDSARTTALTDSTGTTSFIHKMSTVCKSYYTTITAEISVKLLQVGYQTLSCIRDFLSKLPNIYITTEWDDKDRDISDSTTFDINNDLYIQGIVLWFIPTDANGIESMRVYPCHMIDHEMPIMAGLSLVNEQSQGTTVYDWSMLNVFNPAQMNLNPLIENMGLISFSPTLTANTMPLAYYDSNVNGYLKATFKNGDGDDSLGHPINLKQGSVKIQSIGINGVASVNLSLFRLVF